MARIFCDLDESAASSTEVNLFGHRLSVSAVVGLAIMAINIAAIALAPWIAPYGQAELVGDVWAGPNANRAGRECCRPRR